MKEPKQPNIFDNIQQICSEFRRELKAGRSGEIDQYLLRIDESARDTLFQNLLHLDIEFQRRGGKNPSSDGYINRFPSYARVIRQAFFESTIMSQEFFGDTPDSDQQTVSLSIPAARKLGKYELIRELGRGGFGVVYEAQHLQRQERVALKTLPMILDGQSESARDAERLHRFRREFRALSEINHPHLAGMQTLEVDGKQWFFTMDLIDGVDFLEYVRPNGRLDEQRLRATLQQMVRGVIALHDEGIVHRDLKPSNLLIDSHGHLVLLDFGLVTELQNLASQTLSIGTKHFAGTPRYAAPEQASGQRAPAVDWYAVGVMLYEALTGEVPFKGSGIELMIAKQTKDPPVLSQRDEIPKDLAELTDALLRKDPKQRPRDDEVAAVLGIQPESSLQNASADSSEVGDSVDHSEEFLIGREKQLNKLDEILRSFLNSGQSQVAFISGRSGEGKTSLAEKFLSRVRRDGDSLVLAGRCYDRESVPFKAIDCLIDPLVAYLRSRSGEELARILPEDIGMLAQLFPVLRRVQAIADRAESTNTTIASRQVRYRAFAALRDLLGTIGEATPVILFVDDLQWGDADSATALHEMLQPADPIPVLLLGAFRSDEAGRSPFLSQWRENHDPAKDGINATVVEVTALTKQQCVVLIAARLGVDPQTLQQQAEQLLEGTRGNPYFLEQLVESFDQETLQFKAVPLSDILRRKLQRLPSEATPLLETISVAGQAVAIEEIATVGEQSANVFATITHMVSERLVRLIGSGHAQQVDTYHDKIRETVLTGMEESRRQDLHRRFAVWLEQHEQLSIERVTECLIQNASSARNHGVGNDRIFDIAHHYFESGHQYAFAYQLLSGITSLISYAGDEALVFLQRAAQTMPEETDDSIRYLLSISRARACLICKNTNLATKYLEQALEFAETDLQQAMAHMGLATADRFLGHYQQGIDRYDLALGLIGKRRPKTMLGSIVSILKDNCAVLLAGAPKTFRDPSQVEESDTTILHYLALREIGGLLLEKDMLAFLVCGSKACRISVRQGTAESLMAGYEWAAGFFAVAGLPIARIYHRRAELVENAANDTQVSEQRLFYNFGYAYWIGDLIPAGEILERSWHIVQRFGEHNEANYRPHMRRHVATFIHSTSVELKWANTTLEHAKELGGEQQICWGTYDVGVAQARRGNLAEATEKMQEALELLSNERHFMTESIRGASLAFICLQCSQYDRATELADEAWRNAVKHLILLDVAAYSLPVLMESLAGPRWIDGIAADKCRRLRRLGWWAKGLFRMLPNQQPHLLRMLGRYQAGRGRHRKALIQFKRSVDNARARGMSYAEARALLDLAAISPHDADALRRQAVQLLMEAEAVLPFAERWLLGKQDHPDVVAPPPPDVQAIRSTQQERDLRL